ncbi:hypothetical protein [Sandarakinorhabdus oryzae]|uniref:hypothetical protein n=1 Tax=Sandarakinorhabdus oryzae TaxID=2675220 RepID=UPI0012E1C926|nr:hypothetical protein [Sandarakinorhabdus oryzae]
MTNESLRPGFEPDRKSPSFGKLLKSALLAALVSGVVNGFIVVVDFLLSNSSHEKTAIVIGFQFTSTFLLFLMANFAPMLLAASLGTVLAKRVENTAVRGLFWLLNGGACGFLAISVAVAMAPGKIPAAEVSSFVGPLSLFVTAGLVGGIVLRDMLDPR